MFLIVLITKLERDLISGVSPQYFGEDDAPVPVRWSLHITRMMHL